MINEYLLNKLIASRIYLFYYLCFINYYHYFKNRDYTTDNKQNISIYHRIYISEYICGKYQDIGLIRLHN